MTPEQQAAETLVRVWVAQATDGQPHAELASAMISSAAAMLMCLEGPQATAENLRAVADHISSATPTDNADAAGAVLAQE